MLWFAHLQGTKLKINDKRVKTTSLKITSHVQLSSNKWMIYLWILGVEARHVYAHVCLVFVRDGFSNHVGARRSESYSQQRPYQQCVYCTPSRQL